MSDSAVIPHDREWIARDDFFDHVNIWKHGAGGRCESCNATVAFREVTFADERADDAVSYGVHEIFEKEKVYTIARELRDFEERCVFGKNFSDDAGRDIVTRERGERSVSELGRDGHE
jgi:hypothetical protein